VARALVLRPQVLLFDEPLSNLDARLRRQVREDIRDLQKRLGLTVVYVTHDQQEALAVSDLVCVMRAGKIAQMGTPRELYDEPADAFIADFMGEANVLQGEVLGPGRISLAGVALETRLRPHPPGAALLAIRPEAVSLHADGEGLRGQIKRAAFLGQTHEYEVATPAGQIFVVAPAGMAVFAPGDDVWCRFRGAIALEKSESQTK
jgi:iron(III) transport system ATP-binding protein